MACTTLCVCLSSLPPPLFSGAGRLRPCPSQHDPDPPGLSWHVSHILRTHPGQAPLTFQTAKHTPSLCIFTAHALYPQRTLLPTQIYTSPQPPGWLLNPQASVEMLGWRAREEGAGGSCTKAEGRSEGRHSLTWTPAPLSPLHREEPKLCHLLLHRAQGL